MSENYSQDLSQKAEFANMFMIELLFENKPEPIDSDALFEAVQEKFGEAEAVAKEGEMLSYALYKYTAHFKDADLPAQVMLAQGLGFEPAKIDEFTRSQMWDVEDGRAILDRCRYKCFISDFFGGAALDYSERCEMLMDWLEVVLPFYPDCTAVWTPTAGKLTLPSDILNRNVPRSQRFIHTCVNARFFNISGSDAMVVDTLGMYAVDLPDVQLHFHGLDPNHVVNYVYNICVYNYDNDCPVKSGETIGGLDSSGHIDSDIYWRCQYEDSLIQPVRTVLDIEAGEFASGQRQ